MKLIHAFWVDLGWTKRRQIRVMNDGRAYFEIAEQGHCSTCQRRIDNFKQATTKSGTDVEYAHLFDRYPADAKTLWGGIAVPDIISEEALDKLFPEPTSLRNLYREDKIQKLFLEKAGLVMRYSFGS